MHLEHCLSSLTSEKLSASFVWTSCSTFLKIWNSELCPLCSWEGLPATVQLLDWRSWERHRKIKPRGCNSCVKTYSQVVFETTVPSSVQDWFKRRFRESSDNQLGFFFNKKISADKSNLAQQSVSYYTESNFVSNLRAIYTLDIFWHPDQGTFVWVVVW